MKASRPVIVAMAGFMLPFAAAHAQTQEIPAWSYVGEENSELAWPFLSPEYRLCDTGTSQSPVSVGETTIDPALPALEFHYTPTQAAITHTADIKLELTFQNGGTLQEGETTYRLQKAQFHTPGEHARLERTSPMEIHLVHADSAGNQLTVALLVETGLTPLPVLESLFSRFASSDAPDLATPLAFNAASLLPESRGYYAYSGSITTPPCTEGMEWRILKTPIVVSRSQLEALGKLVGRNSRSLQPVYMRSIRETP